MKNLASEKKKNKGKRVNKKTSPKRENTKPELKLLFEKIRKKKRDAKKEKKMSSGDFHLTLQAVLTSPRMCMQGC